MESNQLRGPVGAVSHLVQLFGLSVPVPNGPWTSTSYGAGLGLGTPARTGDQEENPECIR